MNDLDLKTILDHKDNTIGKQAEKIKRQENIIEAQKQTIDFLWSLIEDKQHKLDRQKEHPNQLTLKL